jgi:hypothetical protein
VLNTKGSTLCFMGEKKVDALVQAVICRALSRKSLAINKKTFSER